MFVNTEMLITDESSYLQELDCSEAERKTDNDLFALTARNSSNDTVNGFGGTLVSGFLMFCRPKCTSWLHFVLGFLFKQVKKLLTYI